MLPLVFAGQDALVGCRSNGGDGSLVHARDGRRVVTESEDGGVAGVMEPTYQVELAEHASVFQVAVGDGAVRVVGAHKALLDLLGKRQSPHVGLSLGVVVDAAHAGFGCVGCPQEGRLLWDYFGEVRGSLA